MPVACLERRYRIRKECLSIQQGTPSHLEYGLKSDRLNEKKQSIGESDGARRIVTILLVPGIPCVSTIPPSRPLPLHSRHRFYRRPEIDRERISNLAFDYDMI